MPRRSPIAKMAVEALHMNLIVALDQAAEDAAYGDSKSAYEHICTARSMAAELRMRGTQGSLFLDELAHNGTR